MLGGDLDLASPAGRHIVGHELAHTVQSRLGAGSAGSGGAAGAAGRISDPTWSSEREAERAAASATANGRYEIRERGGDDLHRIAPWLILAGIGLAAGLIVWAASDSPDQNEQRHAAGGADPSRDWWALVPIYGSVQQIREAESYFQRVLGVGFLMLDFTSLGTAGIAGRALLKVPGALGRTIATRRGAALAIKEGGELATEAMARDTAENFARHGGAVMTSRAAAAAEMTSTLERGGLVVVAEGLSHTAVYARNAAGEAIRVHGGPTKVLLDRTTEPITKASGLRLSMRTAAYAVVEAGEATVPIEQVIERVQRGGPALLRWLGGNPTSCGIMASAVLESSGLPEATLRALVPAGGAAERLIPITLLDHMASTGKLRLVEGGTAQIIGGTRAQGIAAGVGAVAGPVASAVLRVTVTRGAEALGDAVTGETSGSRTSSSDDAAYRIVERFGRRLIGPVETVRAALPELVPGWFVRGPDFHQSVMASLVATGMDAATARSIALG